MSNFRSLLGQPLLGKLLHAALALAFCFSFSAVAEAERPFVVVRDPGAYVRFRETAASVNALDRAMIREYLATQSPLPEVLSVWSTHPLGGSNSQFTLFLPHGNRIGGIGMQHGGPPYSSHAQGVFASDREPLQAILLHNNIRALAQSASNHGADDPLAYAEYLFLLELGHLVGPALQVEGASPALLTGNDPSWTFHWSFWMDAGGSALGGSRLRPNADGTFTVLRTDPAALGYSMLDLYLFGLASADEVLPFYVLDNVTEIPSGILDPLWQSGISARTFPWMSNQEIRVRGTKRSVNMEEIIRANGLRTPAVSEAPKTISVGIMLVVPNESSDEEFEQAAELFAPIATRLKAAFERATQGRGTLDIVSRSASPHVDAQVPDSGLTDAGSGTRPSASCSLQHRTVRLRKSSPNLFLWLGVQMFTCVLVMLRRRRTKLA